MNFFNRTIYWLYKRRKILLVLLLVAVTVIPAIVHAQAEGGAPAAGDAPGRAAGGEGAPAAGGAGAAGGAAATPAQTPAKSAEEVDREITENIQGYALFGLRFITAIFWPILMLIGGLLDNSLIFDGKMGETLLEIWVQVRNIVNIIFVVILVLIALYNVLGLGESGPEVLKPLELKQSLPKFVIALIVVNFSYLGAKVVLDATNVLTTAVFALPSQVTESDKNFEKFKSETEEILCAKDSPFYGMFCSQGKFNDAARNYFQGVDRSNIAVAMAIQFGQLPYATRIKDNIDGIFQLSMNILFSLVLYVVYAISFIVLFIVLVVRLPFLWLGIALSPLLGLSMAFPAITKLAGEGGGNLGTKFMKHALAPFIIGLSLTIGYIMVSALRADPTINNGQFAISLTNIDPNTLFTRIDDLQEFLMMAATVAVVWMGVFMAAKDTVAQGITEKIKGGAEGVGKFLAKLPLYAQVIPYKKGGPKIGLGNIWGSIQKKMREKTTEQMTPIDEVPTEDAKHVMATQDPHNVMERLNDNRLGTVGNEAVFKHILETLQRMENFDKEKDSNKQLIERLRGSSSTRERLQYMYRLAKENPMSRDLQTLIKGFTSEEAFVSAGLEHEQSERESAASREASEERPRTVSDNQSLLENLERIQSNPSSYTNYAIFNGLSQDQIQEFAREVGRAGLTDEQFQRLNPIQNGTLRFRTAAGDFDPQMLRAEIERIKPEAAPPTPPESPQGPTAG